MKTILYLVDIPAGKLVETYEGENNLIPDEAKKRAQKESNESGDGHVIARGELFFQSETSHDFVHRNLTRLKKEATACAEMNTNKGASGEWKKAYLEIVKAAEGLLQLSEKYG